MTLLCRCSSLSSTHHDAAGFSFVFFADSDVILEGSYCGVPHDLWQFNSSLEKGGRAR